MSERTYNAAYRFARELAQAGDRKGALKLMSGLLWHVDRESGGFIGLSDLQLKAKVEADARLDFLHVIDAMYAPPPWPHGAEPALARAA